MSSSNIQSERDISSLKHEARECVVPKGRMRILSRAGGICVIRSLLRS